MRDDRWVAARRVSVCGSGRVLRLEIVDFLQRSSRGLMISAWQPGLAVDMSAWRGARELPRSPPREPPDPSPRVSDITSPRSWSALESSFESSDDDGSSDDDEPETLLYVAPRGRFATGGVGAVGRPAGVTRRAPPLHAYVSSLTGEPCAPLGQDDTTPRHRCATSGVTTAYAHEHRSPGWTGSRSDDDGSGASSMDDDRPLHRAERAERRRAAAESAARREARAMERERRRGTAGQSDEVPRATCRETLTAAMTITKTSGRTRGAIRVRGPCARCASTRARRCSARRRGFRPRWTPRSSTRRWTDARSTSASWPCASPRARPNSACETLPRCRTFP